jgi:hypothetical protein
MWNTNNPDKHKERLAKWRLENPDKVKENRYKNYWGNYEATKAKRLRWRKENAEKITAQNVKWNLNNKEKRKAWCEKWRKNNPSLHAERERVRNGVKKQATPVWANRKLMDDIYARALEKSRITGIDYHVDHIVPLQGKNVCGFNWEGNLQIITAVENVKKGNRLIANVATNAK